MAQAEARLAAGLGGGGSPYVVVDEVGQPVRPDRLSRAWAAALRGAGVRVVRLHDARHSAATAMHLAGVPISVVAAWLGHADASFTMRTYAHSQPDALASAGAVLGAVVTLGDTESLETGGDASVSTL